MYVYVITTSNAVRILPAGNSMLFGWLLGGFALSWGPLGGTCAYGSVFPHKRRLRLRLEGQSLAYGLGAG